MTSPTLELERSLQNEGHRVVVGVDEVGRGCWAGMVTVGAVYFNNVEDIPEGIRDSKLLSPKQRSQLFSEIIHSAEVGIGSASEDEIDRFGIVQALRLAAERALALLPRRADAVVLDGSSNYLSKKLRVLARPKADSLSLSVAAASIVAKVTRDRLMELYDAVYPGYGFGAHKGYGSAFHSQMLEQRGVSEVHRRSFAPMKYMPE